MSAIFVKGISSWGYPCRKLCFYFYRRCRTEWLLRGVRHSKVIFMRINKILSFIDNYRENKEWNIHIVEYSLYEVTHNGSKLTISEKLKPLIWRYFLIYWNTRRICSSNGGLTPIVKRKLYYASIEQVAKKISWRKSVKGYW